MNREATIEAIKVMQAEVDGNDIEMYRLAQGFSDENIQWYPHQGGWNWSEYGFRIKPKEPREFWINADEKTNEGWIKVREVLDEERKR